MLNKIYTVASLQINREMAFKIYSVLDDSDILAKRHVSSDINFELFLSQQVQTNGSNADTRTLSAYKVA